MANFPKPTPVNDDPPQPGKPTGNLKQTPRSQETGEKKPLQFKVPEEVFNEFSARAHEDFGHKKGAKLELFMAMWEAYQKGS